MTQENINIITNELHKATESFREKTEGVDFKKVKEFLDYNKKYSEIFDKQEEKNQELERSLANAEKQIKEAEEKYNKLELAVRNPNLKGNEKELAEKELKNFENYMRYGANSKSVNKELLRSSIDHKFLRTDSDENGGVTVPFTLETEIIKEISEISNMDAICKVVNMGTKSNQIPKRISNVDSYMVGEGEQGQNSESDYGKYDLVAKKGQANVIISKELLEDSNNDFDREIRLDVAESMAVLRGRQFVNGSGQGNNVEGILTNSDIPFIETATSGVLDFDSLIAVTNIKTGYLTRARYGFNRNTLIKIRQLKDNAGNYIWRAGNIGAGVPNQINGYSYSELPDLPNVASDTYPILFGDFYSAYKIGNRKDMTMIRDEITLKKRGQIEFTFDFRFAGGVVLPEAMNKLKIKV